MRGAEPTDSGGLAERQWREVRAAKRRLSAFSVVHPNSAEQRAAEQEPSACFALALVLLDDGRKKLEDLVLLSARQLGDLVEDTLKLAYWPWAALLDRLIAEDVFDAYSERLGEERQNVRARRDGRGFPEADGFWGNPNELSELSLTEPCRLAQRNEASCLFGAWLSEMTRHAGIVGVHFRILLFEEKKRLLDSWYTR